MKKLLTLLLLIFVGVGIASAQNKTDLGNGIKIVRYGNITIVEDDINQRSYRLEVKEKGKNSIGERLYYVMCENKYSKAVTKFALEGVIRTTLTSAGVPPTVTSVATKIANLAYDDACKYFKDK